MEDFLRLDMMVAAGGVNNGCAGVADCVEDTAVFGCCWCWPRTSVSWFVKGTYLGGLELMAVDTGRWMEFNLQCASGRARTA